MPRLHLPPGVVSSILAWTYRSPEANLPHTHSFYELFWVESGKGWHWIEGDRRLMTPGYLALIRPEDSHTFSVTEAGVEVTFYNFAMQASLWKRMKRVFFSGRPQFFSEPDYRKREWMLNEPERERVLLLASDLLSGAEDALSAEAFTLGLFSLLANQQKRLHRALDLPPWLATACDSIRIWPHFKGGVEGFVRAAGRSPEHVARECRRHLGKTPSDLVNEARLEYAAAQLRTSNHSILDIAFESGFENAGYFYQRFRQRFGQPPRRYRLQHFSKAQESK